MLLPTFAINTVNGSINFVPASMSIAPYTYSGSLKIDAKGRIVVPG